MRKENVNSNKGNPSSVLVVFIMIIGVIIACLVNVKLTNSVGLMDDYQSTFYGHVSAEELKTKWTKEEVEILKEKERQNILNTYSINVANTQEPNLFTRDALIKAINHVYGDQALKGLGEIVVMAGEIIQVNPRLVAAISSYESRGQTASGKWVVGNSWNSHNLNNISGMNARSGTKWNGQPVDYGRGGRENRYCKYPNVSESIFDLTFRLKEVYINQGLETLSDIGAKYAPTNDKWEGLYGMTNHGWDSRVQYYYDLITDLAIKYTNESGGN
jgi:DNA-directed RNA polymerase subunit H (RpoH/RPB5)